MTRKYVARVVLVVSFLVLINLTVQSVGSVIYWSPDRQLTTDTTSDMSPSITRTSDGKIWFVWQSYRINNLANLFYKVYDPSKVNPWSLDTRLTFNSGQNSTFGQNVQPSIMQAADGRIWVVWVTKRTSTTNFDIYYKICNGSSWGPDTKLPISAETTPLMAGSYLFPSIVQSTDGKIWIFWSSRRDNDWDDDGVNGHIYYKTSFDNGISWSLDTKLTSIYSLGNDDLDPAVTRISDGKIWLVWTREDDIFYTIYNGVSWTSATSVYTSSNDDWHSSVTQAADGKIWVAWDNGPVPTPQGAPPHHLYYNIYSGTGWLGASNLTADPAEREDNYPSLTRALDGAIWVSWSSDRKANFDIFYKTTGIAPAHDLAVMSVLPAKSIVSQGRSVSVDVVAQNLGTSSETFDIELYANSTLAGSNRGLSLGPGDLLYKTINWSTTGFALGTYTVTAKVSTLPGEINTADNTYIDGKVTVVIHDVAIINVTTSSTQAYQGYTTVVYIYVQVRNQGTIQEDVTVETYRNTTLIGIQTIYSVAPTNNATFTFLFFTEGIPHNYYHIIAKASPMPDEIDFFNNNMEDGTVILTVPGDVNGDGRVDVYDLALVREHWTDPPEGPLGYNKNIDINGDGSIDSGEIAIVSLYYGRSV